MPELIESTHKINKKIDFQAIERLDLSYIVLQMCSKAYPLPRWKLEDAKTCQLLYKRFLWLLILYPDHSLVPTKEIDEFWHNHILHTKRYINDCYQLAGRYIHHHPADLETVDQKQLLENFKLTQSLYLKEFSQELEVFV